jgi:tetratricopeptide (TPR) repeat protein
LHPSSPADYVLEGSIEFHDDGFRLLLQLLQSADRSYIWSETMDGQLQDLSSVDHLAQQLVRDLTAPAGEAVIARRQPDRTESGDAYLEGRYLWKLATPDSIRNSIAFFTKAVEADPNYGAAWAALSEALLVSSIFGLLPPTETHPRMKEAAIRATSLNPSLPEARVALGAVLSLLDWDWAAGEEEIQKSIQLDKSDPVGHIVYGIQLACRGEQVAAIAEVERALELDPASLFPNFVLGWLYGVCRRFDEAIGQHLLVSRLATDYGLPHLGLGMACAGKGQFGDAIAHLTNATQMKCGSLLHGQMGYCYARSGRREEALREIGILNTRSESSYVSPMSFAAIYSGLGEEDEALRYLERAVEVRDTSLHLRLLSSEFDNLQDHPRFQELRSQIGLRQARYAFSA